MGAAHLHHLPGLEDIRVAAERAGLRAARDAEHLVEFPDVDLRTAQRGGIARADRGAEVDVQRPPPLPGRSARFQGAARIVDLARLWSRPRQADRPESCALR